MTASGLRSRDGGSDGRDRSSITTPGQRNPTRSTTGVSFSLARGQSCVSVGTLGSSTRRAATMWSGLTQIPSTVSIHDALARCAHRSISVWAVAVARLDVTSFAGRQPQFDERRHGQRAYWSPPLVPAGASSIMLLEQDRPELFEADGAWVGECAQDRLALVGFERESRHVAIECGAELVREHLVIELVRKLEYECISDLDAGQEHRAQPTPASAGTADQATGTTWPTSPAVACHSCRSSKTVRSSASPYGQSRNARRIASRSTELSTTTVRSAL